MKTKTNQDADGVRLRKPHFSQEYIREALDLWRKSGRSATAVAAQLGIRRPLLYRWSAAQRRTTGSKSESPTLPVPGSRSVAELEAEIRRLRDENEKLLEQREILKKSLGIFSEAPPRGMPRSKP